MQEVGCKTDGAVFWIRIRIGSVFRSLLDQDQDQDPFSE